MLIPIRCMSCGKVLADKWEYYKKKCEENESKKELLDKLGLKKYCCRRVFLGHVDLIDEL